MISAFLKERRSWIGFFLLSQLLMLFIAFIDKTIPLMPVVYMIFLGVILFAGFLALRFKRETRFYRSLQQWDHDLDLSDIAEPVSPLQQITSEAITLQTERLKRLSDENRMLMQTEKDEMLSWIHEVKTPLTAMHLILDRVEDQQTKSQLTYEWLRIHLLLDQQLHQKRIPFIQNDLYIEKIDVATVLSAELKTLRSWCMQKKIGVEVDLQEQEVLTDGKWLSFIIRQLLTNAVKYSENSDIIVTSAVKDERLFLTVKDNGRGMAVKDLPRIFDKGFTTTSNHHDQAATGMGLYLAKKAADSLHIAIQVRSTPGHGSEFTLIFPKQNEMSRIIGM
ncbi:sensor histidine kinase [Fictibacillus iocasae]|uniref:histidine kinase n=1 Tax=Fictibacillus iocasae TaxID=2715437 RepID=A0ABW2NLY6_9BACL